MPATKKITKQMIIDAGFEIFRKEGFEAVTARAIAKKINCSTQPIYLEYKNMTDLKNELIEKVVSVQADMFKKLREEISGDMTFRIYGTALLKFAQEEPFLYRQIYLIDGNFGKKVDALREDKLLEIIAGECGYSEKKSLDFKNFMQVYLHGLACEICSGYSVYSDEQIHLELGKMFMAAVALYGIPPKLRDDSDFMKKYHNMVSASNN